MNTWFARDSESPRTSSIDTEDLPIEQVIMTSQLDRDFRQMFQADEAEEQDEWVYLQSDDEEGANEYVFVGPALVPTREWGQNFPDWVDFNKTFPSSDKYIKEITRFLCYHEARENCGEEHLLESVKAYFTDNMDPEKTAEEDRRAPTTMKGVMSMLMKFWLYTQRGDLKRLAPLIIDKLKTWSKSYKITKAPVFSKRDMSKYITHSYY
jgi:hypothetical protein